MPSESYPIEGQNQTIAKTRFAPGARDAAAGDVIVAAALDGFEAMRSAGNAASD